MVAVGLGARIIEKHFTISKSYSDFRDHQLSADPEEMAQLVREISKVMKLLGNGNKIMQPSEKASENLMRRSIVAKRDILSNTRIERDDITWIRPAGGLPPGKEELVLGKYLSKSLKMGDLIVPDILHDEGNK